jgi:uncharacterized protein YaeQ
MALGATLYSFYIALSDMDRNVYETLDLRVALHPGEAVDYMLTRVLAYCLEYREGIAFSKGLAESDEPAVWAHDLTGQLTTWIDIGAPSAERLHRATKLAERVVVYTHKDVAVVKHNLGRLPTHRVRQVPLRVIDWQFLAAFEEALARRVNCTLTITEGQLYLEVNGETLQTVVEEHRLG